jgi:hypothetical protein
MRSELPKQLKLRIANEVITVIALIAVGVLLFLSWDSAGRNSFELLGVIHRLDLLPEYIPTRPILMLWVLLPVFLGLGVKGSIQRFFRSLNGGQSETRQVWLLPFLISCVLVSYVVTLAPTATAVPRWCLGFSIASVLTVVAGILPLRADESEA